MNDPIRPVYPSAPTTNTLAMVSLVSAAVSWLMIPLLAAIVAIVTGHMARSEIKRSQGMQDGDALAIIGLILGYLNVVASCVLPLLVLGGVISIGGICSLCAVLSETGSLVIAFLAL